MKLYITVLLATISASIIFFIADYNRGLKQDYIDQNWDKFANIRLSDFGSTTAVSITPLVNWDAISEDYQTEAGVSYLVETDDYRILFDVGFNQNNAEHSPLMQNMERAGIEMDSIDGIFISHAHRDHVGGIEWEKKKTFSIGARSPNISSKKLFLPKGMNYPLAKSLVNIDQPTVLVKGMASTGLIARQLFMGRIDEQALVVDLAGKGLVVIVGCGHQTLEKLLLRIKTAFGKPVYAIVGDLHFPVPNGRLKSLGIDLQRLFASGNGPFSPLTMSDIDAFEAQLNDNVKQIALGGHDTSDYVLERFKTTFGDRFHRVRVGETFHIK